LDFLGFPWILSSETRLINGLHGIFAEEIFLALSTRKFESRRREKPILEGESAGLFIRASLVLFLIFHNILTESFAERADFAVTGLLLGIEA
jgi:hypothetical protein